MSEDREHTQKEIEENRKLWVEALRSGEYKQTGCFLYHQPENGFCCLGVAAKVFDVPVDTWSEDDLGMSNLRSDTRTIPVADKLGLTSSDCLALAKLNDDFNMSFEKIADRIENNNFSSNPYKNGTEV